MSTTIADSDLDDLDYRATQIVAFIARHIETHGFAPSVREIGDGVGLSSTSSVQYQLNRLIRLGILQRVAGRARTVTLTEGVAA
jgi:repressor LexA